MSAPIPPAAASLPPPVAAFTREELLQVLDRETAVARATDGRLAVLVLELRRVDRLQALMRGPAPATTMGLVLDRLRKALREEDRMAAISDCPCSMSPCANSTCFSQARPCSRARSRTRQRTR